MKRLLTKYMVIIITILIANLIGELFIKYLFGLTDRKTYTSVLIQMAALVVVFVPALTLLESYIKTASKKYIQQSKKATGNGTLGLLIGFIIAIGALTLAYGYVWYDLKIW